MEERTRESREERCESRGCLHMWWSSSQGRVVKRETDGTPWLVFLVAALCASLHSFTSARLVSRASTSLPWTARSASSPWMARSASSRRPHAELCFESEEHVKKLRNLTWRRFLRHNPQCIYNMDFLSGVALQSSLEMIS